MMNSATTVSRVATRSGAKRVATRSGANPSSAVRRVAAPVVSVGGFGCTAAARRSGGVSLSSSRNAVVVRAAEEGGEGSEGGGDGIAFEPKSKSKRKRRTGENTRRAKINVEGMAIDAAKGVAPITVQSASEEAYILFLFGYVVVIFLGGLMLAISAFDVLPDNINTWVEDSLYPAYSPTVIGFLVFSSIYGVIKTRTDPDSV